MKIYEQLGRVALGTRVRFLGEQITADAAQVYALYGIDMNPKWFPVFYALTQAREKTITSLAEEIGHSHVSVSKIVREMIKAGLVKEKSSAADRRRTMVSLTPAGAKIAVKIEDQLKDVRSAVDEMSARAKHDLWEALEEWESLLTQKSLLRRVIEQKKARESSGVRIVPYKPEYREAFQKLNEDWIKTHFKIEKADRVALEDPEGYILKRGGFIFVAVLDARPVGVCAILKRDDPKYPYELAKMAVDRNERGKNIGWLLGKAVIEKTRELGAKKVFLESNTKLTPAMGLYDKLGFKKITGPATPYERCNIQMELRLR